ncbi:glycoside hydrolase family 43 protein [Gorillibacterium sp. sgz5001074]|uniref:glycoside hydrolase family 43 protein n=1 Tax=Gorillibacterium sp. sgz5001074 TaxID=3446695 RepID=UPI003F66F6CF
MSKEQGMKSVWVADLGDGTYRNPILYADYSDPDMVRVGEDFYMTASSFAHSPGLPVLHSKDLVNWTLIAHAVDVLPGGYDGCVRHGDGVWAPSIRYHDGKYWIFFSAPDEGIYMTTAENPAGPWSPLHMVKEVKGWIDPCPFWDDDGQAYLVHAFARSRCGIKHRLKMCRMKPDGTALLDDGVVIFDGEQDHPTMEGPKMYKRNGYYYIFAPAGGVPTGWQTILRSKSVFGPYEDKIVLAQGSTEVNGPHQGGYVELESGESWFVHFQDREAYGRIVHLQPMGWENDWPYMGTSTGDSVLGEPVIIHKKPNVGKEWPAAEPETNDEFDLPVLGLQWQWQGNRKSGWSSLKANPGHLRLYTQPLPEGGTTLYHAPSVIGQKLPAPEFTAEAKLDFHPGAVGERAGLTVFGHDYAYVALEKTETGLKLVYVTGHGSKEGSTETVADAVELPAGTSTVFLRTTCVLEAVFTWAYSLDGQSYKTIGSAFTAVPGGWVGAKLGLFSLRMNGAEGYEGYTDVDWFRFRK